MSELPPRKFFALRTPCRDCPFRADLDFPLSTARRHDIAASLRSGENFICHKTITYSGDEDESGADQSRGTACAGARETARRSGIVSQSEQVITRLGVDVPATDPQAPVHRDLDAWERW